MPIPYFFLLLIEGAWQLWFVEQKLCRAKLERPSFKVSRTVIDTYFILVRARAQSRINACCRSFFGCPAGSSDTVVRSAAGSCSTSIPFIHHTERPPLRDVCATLLWENMGFDRDLTQTCISLEREREKSSCLSSSRFLQQH